MTGTFPRSLIKLEEEQKDALIRLMCNLRMVVRGTCFSGMRRLVLCLLFWYMKQKEAVELIPSEE